MVSKERGVNLRNDFNGLDDRYGNNDRIGNDNRRWKHIDNDDNYYIQSGYHSRSTKKNNSHDDYNGWDDEY